MRTNELKAYFIRNDLSRDQVADRLGIHPGSLSRKLRRGHFTVDEAAQLTRILKIEDPASLFFDLK